VASRGTVVAGGKKLLSPVEMTEIFGMWVWRKIVTFLFPGTYEEYLATLKIHFAEVRVYRKRVQFVIGYCFFCLPLGYLLLTCDDWVTAVLITSIVLGSACIHDTITIHYCLLLHRMGYRNPADPAPNATTVEPVAAPKPRLHYGKIMLIYLIVGPLGACVSFLVGKFSSNPEQIARRLSLVPIIVLPFLINWLATKESSSWLVCKTDA
jgi:hypothetical protein